jgi:hypothetical protein
MAMILDDYVSSLENDPHWQATAINDKGSPVVIMRGHPGGPYENGYYTEPIEIRYPFVLSGIKDLFASHTLMLVKGGIPTTEND